MLQTMSMLSLDKNFLMVSVANKRKPVFNQLFPAGLVQILIQINYYHSECAPLNILNAETKVRLFSTAQVQI